MNTPSSSSKMYSHAPELPKNLILATLRLFFWLVFHPSAWRSYVRRIDPGLRSNFSLVDLKLEQWRNPVLQRLILMAYFIWPVLVGLLTGFAFWFADISGPVLAWSVVTAVFGGFAGSLTISISLNVAGGISAGVIGGLTAGVAGYAVYGDLPDMSVAIIQSVSLALTAGVTAAIASSTVSRGLAHYSILRQMGGVVVGILISGAVIGVATGIVLTIFKAGIGETLGLAFSTNQSSAGNNLLGFVAGIILGAGYGIAIVMRTRKRFAIIHGVIYSILLGLSFFLSSDVTPIAIRSIARGVSEGMIFSALFALPYIIAENIGGPWAGAVAGAFGSYGVYIAYRFILGETVLWPILSIGIVFLLSGLSLAWWRPAAMYPFVAAWNTLLYYIDRRRPLSQKKLLSWHSAFWDEHQRLPLYGLDNYLIMVAERNQTEGEKAIEYIADGFQQWAAQTAQIELEMRWASWLVSVQDIEGIINADTRLESRELERPTSSLLRTFWYYSQDVKAALNQTTPQNQRLALRDVEIRMNRLLRELEQRNDAYASRFYPVAANWHKIISNHLQKLTERVELSHEIDNPYIFGVPLTEQQDLFVGRTDISSYIEQLLLDRRRPPLLLYGQRRMGKTSLLHNLSRLLPSTILLLYVDGQGIAGASDYGDFLYNLARQMINSAKRHQSVRLPPISRDRLEVSPFTTFDEWLDVVEEKLEDEGRNMALLALDEFEAIESVLDKGRFDEKDLFNLFRHLNQHRSRFKMLLAGSHTLEEFERWASYLINMQVIHVGYLKESEARQLIERPVKDFVLRYEAEACQRVLTLTRGHPHLVQLLCYEIVALKNEQSPMERRLVRLEDVKAAMPKALEHGSFFFADIERNQVGEMGLALLRFLASQGEGVIVNKNLLTERFSDTLDGALDQLLKRELIEPVDGGYRFQVELIRQWFVK